MAGNTRVPDTADDAPRRGRRRKFPLETVRERMIQSSLELLTQGGVSTRLDAISIDRALLEAEVPRGSAYTAWAHTCRSPQENLQHAVMMQVLQATTGNNAATTGDYALTVVAAFAEQVNSSDLAIRRVARSEITRQVAKFNHDRLNSDMWRLYRSLAITVTTQPSPDPELVAAIEAGEARLVDAYSRLFTDLGALFDMTLKPGLTMRNFSIAMIALNDGLSNHTTTAFDHSEPIVVDGADWTLFAYCCDALYDAFFDM